MRQLYLAKKFDEEEDIDTRWMKRIKIRSYLSSLFWLNRSDRFHRLANKIGAKVSRHIAQTGIQSIFLISPQDAFTREDLIPFVYKAIFDSLETFGSTVGALFETYGEHQVRMRQIDVDLLQIIFGHFLYFATHRTLSGHRDAVVLMGGFSNEFERIDHRVIVSEPCVMSEKRWRGKGLFPVGNVIARFIIDEMGRDLLNYTIMGTNVRALNATKRLVDAVYGYIPSYVYNPLFFLPLNSHPATIDVLRTIGLSKRVRNQSRMKPFKEYDMDWGAVSNLLPDV
jgi:hypothetical protein